MITRLEIDGFKSFKDFAVDLPALVAVVGPNASGKSNIFDALQLMSRLVTMPVAEALARGRGEPEEQFRQRGDGTRVEEMRFAAELLVERSVQDAFGSDVEIGHTRLKYAIRVRRRDDGRGDRRPVVVEEVITPIAKGNDRWADDVSQAFADEHLRYGGSQWKILATERRPDGQPFFKLSASRARGHTTGRPRELPADRAVSSVLSSVTTALEHPLPYAVRQEIAGWRFLQLEPTSLRKPSEVGSPADHLSGSGENLAWVLELVRRASDEDGVSGLDDVAEDLARVISGFRSVSVAQNEARGQWELSLQTRDERAVSARVASDGTLRLLALLTALHEPDRPGVLCFEEPENGINPGRLEAMLAVLRGLVSDTAGAGTGRDQGLVQLLVSSHSPSLPLVLSPDELVVVDSVGLPEEGAGAVSRITRARRIRASVRGAAGQETMDGPDWPDLPSGTEGRLTGISRAQAQLVVDSA